MGPARLVQRTALMAVGGGQHRVLQQVPDPNQVEPAVAGQAERSLEVLLLEQPGAKLDDQVGFRVGRIPEVVRGARSDRQGLARSEFETVPVHHEAGTPSHNEEPGLLDGMDVGDAHTALRGKPGLVLQQLTIRFRNRLEEPDALAVERILDDRSGRRAPVVCRTGVDGVPKYPTVRCVFARIFTPSGLSPDPPNRTCILGAGGGRRTRRRWWVVMLTLPSSAGCPTCAGPRARPRRSAPSPPPSSTSIGTMAGRSTSRT